MHSPVHLHLPEVAASLALAAARAVEADFAASEQALSRFRPTAELARLNACVGTWCAASPRLYVALAASFRAFRRTRGLFDPRVLGRLEALGYAGAPHEDAPREATDDWLQREPRARRVRLAAPLDLGGIGKGLGVRWGARIIRRLSRNFLLNAGGDLLACGTGPEGRGWQVGVEDPRDPAQLIAALHLPTGGAVCTSSVARNRWQHDGTTVHHLIDPRTGQPGGEGLLAVTVIGEDPAWTEVWSKALFLCGLQDIAQAAGPRPVLWVSETGRLGMTDAARPLVFWRAAGSARSMDPDAGRVGGGQEPGKL